MSPTAAREFLKFGFSTTDQERIADLTERNQSGTLSPAEQAELFEFVDTSHILSALHSVAHLSLKRSRTAKAWMAIDAQLAKAVRHRAGDACEYCLVPQAGYPFLTFPLDHVVARQHRGQTDLRNLALACLHVTATRVRTSPVTIRKPASWHRSSIHVGIVGRGIFVGMRQWFSAALRSVVWLSTSFTWTLSEQSMREGC
jgi:hypothetical protein